MFGSIGWLFADLMFALAMAFLVATTVGQPPRPDAVAHASTAPSRSRSPAPTRSPEPVLELNPVEITLTVDPRGLLTGNASAKAALARAIRRDSRLSGRRAGLVLTFGGALNGSQGQAIAIANQADNVLRGLGAQGYVFRGTVYRPFLALNASPSALKVDVYLFKR